MFNNTFDKTSAADASATGMIAPLSAGGFFLNNTMRDAGGTGSQAWTMINLYAGNWTIRNNVIQQNGSGASSGLFLWAQGTINTATNKNVYYDANPDNSWRKGSTYYGTVASWAAGCGCDAGTKATNPNLNANMTLGAGSSAIGLGDNLSSLGIAALNSDKNGVARGAGAWDAGAYQFSAVAPTGQPGPAPIFF